jgi:hypothetical protein
LPGRTEVEPRVSRSPKPLDGPARPAAERESRVRSVLEIVSLVVAPTTLITALAFYFGWKLTESRAGYFGIDHSTLGFSTEDYLLRSTDALFVPLGVILFFGLVGLAAHVAVAESLGDRRGVVVLRRLVPVTAAIGLVLFGLGAYGVFRDLPFDTHYLFVPLSSGIGIALLTYSVYVWLRLGGRGAPSGRSGSLAIVLVALLVVLSLFWAMSEYAGALGRGRAARLEAGLSSRPGVVVFSKERLNMEAPAVVETRLPGADSSFRFRYSGLRLLIRSGGKYFLLPDGWTRDTGAAVVLPDSEDLRFEFSPGG